MTVKELALILKQYKDQDAKIHIGCQGYTTMNDPDDEYGISVVKCKGNVLIRDNNGYYERR